MIPFRDAMRGSDGDLILASVQICINTPKAEARYPPESRRQCWEASGESRFCKGYPECVYMELRLNISG